MLPLPAALRGCKVFPLVPGGKVPATEAGWKEATDDPAKIAEWQAINPNFNWGVACGLSGLFVIDVDPAGLGWWHDQVNSNGDLALAVKQAFKVKTPRGGQHIYFRGEGPTTASRIATGVDTRGGFIRDGQVVSGGYVVLPGSVLDPHLAANKGAGGSYEVIGNGGTLVPLTPAITSLIPERKKSETHGLERNPDQDQPRNVSWAVDLLQGYVQSGRVSVEGKGGNDTAFRVAASILDKAISPAMCFDLMWDHWNQYCSPPWEDWELETVIRNAAAYGEDTSGGDKGFQANKDAFASFAAEHVEETPPERKNRLLWLHAYADGVQDPTWLIPGFIPARGTGMMFGASGSYKSFLALDVSLCLGFGVAGQWGAPPVKNDVLYLAGEGPVATAKKRWPAWMEWQGISTREDHRVIIMDRVPFYTDTDSWENIKIDLAELKAKPSLIVIDTLSRLLTGLDENSAKDASMVTNFMEQLARYYECFVLALHHTGKEEKKGARGSSAFYANMDTVLSTRLLSTGTELRVRKQKDADVPDEPHFFRVREIADSIVLEQTDALPEEPKAGKARHDWASPNEIVAVLSENGGELSTSLLVQAIALKHGIDANTVKKKIVGRDDLKWLHPDGNTWRVHTAEFDL